VAGTITLPTGTGIDAAGDYIVLATGAADVAVSAKTSVDFALAGTGAIDFVVLKII
jgi:hypothetical protein